MRADYDSEADALDIQLYRFDWYERQEEVDGDYCVVGFAGGRPVDVELLSPAKHLDLLELAARRFDLDGAALSAPARARAGGARSACRAQSRRSTGRLTEFPH